MWSGGRAGTRPISLLQADPDLALDLSPEETEQATRELLAGVTPVTWTEHAGTWGPDQPHGHLGLLVLEGQLLRRVSLLRTYAAEVLGTGDILRPWDIDADEALPFSGEVHWTTLRPVTVAVLDARFLERATRWPTVLAKLTARAVTRAKALALHDAITNLKHVETRLLVQFWHLAERWGRVGVESIAVDVPLTHEMLAALVGATRPSVTTAMGRLADRDLLRREEGTWLLNPNAAEALAPMPVGPETSLHR